MEAAANTISDGSLIPTTTRLLSRAGVVLQLSRHIVELAPPLSSKSTGRKSLWKVLRADVLPGSFRGSSAAVSSQRSLFSS